GVTACGVTLLERNELRLLQAGAGGLDLCGGVDANAEVRQRRPAWLLQGEHDRRVGQFELGVAGLPLGRLGAEQLGVERYGTVEIRHVEGEMEGVHSDRP